ncbi:MAG TPA: hypothetical protein VLD37_04120 [Candidatus Bilamarchaeum sp.]|nr:hypothetical protein [Candidatus Bilamarchaeum sp.]
MKKLYPTFAEVTNYRGKMGRAQKLSAREFEKLQSDILERDRHKCAYCGFQGDEWQTINYSDGDISNNSRSNLTTVCPMCNLILNTPLGCKVEGIVELYESARYPQNKVIQMTRKMRSEGKADAEIIRVLGLKNKVPFKPDKDYLKGLIGFVTSWKGSWGQVEEALQYGYGH